MDIGNFGATDSSKAFSTETEAIRFLFENEFSVELYSYVRVIVNSKPVRTRWQEEWENAHLVLCKKRQLFLYIRKSNIITNKNILQLFQNSHDSKKCVYSD